MANWERYEELRPDALASIVNESPVLFWPLGLLEHHGWHLPVGYDGIKASRTCIRVAEQTGGVLLPTMWWGGGGGHGEFNWTVYEPEEATAQILVRTTECMIAFGFRVLVLLAGHYPWQGTLAKHLPAIQEANPEVLLLWGTEMTICGDAVKMKGDHAALEETSFGLALFPELIDMKAMSSGRDATAWPGGKIPSDQHPAVCFDPNDPLFAQMGEDSRDATAERGEEGISRVVDHLSGTIEKFLDKRDDVQ